MIPEILSTSSLYFFLAASSAAIAAALSYSIFYLKEMNMFCNFSRRSESAETSEAAN